MPILFSVICFSFIVYSLAEAVCGADSPVWKAFSSMTLGALLLLLLHVFEGFTGIAMPISAVSLGVACVLGVPGVLLLAGLNMWFV